MAKHWRLKVNNRIMAWLGVLGVGLLPCPDCGIPLAAHIWPVAAVVWLWRRVRRRSEKQLELILVETGRSAENGQSESDLSS